MTYILFGSVKGVQSLKWNMSYLLFFSFLVLFSVVSLSVFFIIHSTELEYALALDKVKSTKGPGRR